MKKIDAVICIGGGKSQLPLIKEVVALKLALIIIDRNKHSLGFHYADEILQLSTFESAPIIDALHSLEKKYNFIGIVNRSSGIPVITTSEIASSFSLPSISPLMAKTVVNKDLLRVFCKKHNILIPDFQIYEKDDHFFETSLKFPLIAKPSISMIGKSGVTLAKTKDGLKSSILDAKKFSLSGTALLESFIEGVDIEIIGFVKNKMLEIFCMVEEINLVNKSGKVFGRGMKIFDQKSNKVAAKSCVEASKKIINLFNIDHSPFMGAFRVNENGAYLIELHLDIGGDLLLEHLLPYSLSCNYAKLILGYCINSEHESYNHSALPSAIIFDKGSNLVTEKGFNFVKANSFNDLEINIEKILN